MNIAWILWHIIRYTQVYSVIDVTTMCMGLCKQICQFLEIELFTIPYPPVVKKLKEPHQ